MEQYLLSVETSSSFGSVAIHQWSPDSDQTQLLSSVEWQGQKSHSEVITTSTQKALTNAKIDLNDLCYFALDCGPGSFTGIRVGLNLIRALSYSQNKPIFIENSLRILAETSLYETDKPVYVLTNAYKNLIYFAAYKYNGKSVVELSPPAALSLEQIEMTITTPGIGLGTAIDLFSSSFSPTLKAKLLVSKKQLNHPRAQDLGLICRQNLKKSNLFNWNEAKALYLRASEAEEKLRAGLLKPVPKI